MRVCASSKDGVVEPTAVGGRGAASASSSQSIRLTHIDRWRLRPLIAALQFDTRTTGRRRFDASCADHSMSSGLDRPSTAATTTITTTVATAGHDRLRQAGRILTRRSRPTPTTAVR